MNAHSVSETRFILQDTVNLVIKQLLDVGVPMSQDSSGKTPLHYLCQNKDLHRFMKTLDTLLTSINKSNKDVLDVLDNEGKTAFSYYVNTVRSNWHGFKDLHHTDQTDENGNKRRWSCVSFYKFIGRNQNVADFKNTEIPESSPESSFINNVTNFKCTMEYIEFIMQKSNNDNESDIFGKILGKFDMNKNFQDGTYPLGEILRCCSDGRLKKTLDTFLQELKEKTNLDFKHESETHKNVIAIILDIEIDGEMSTEVPSGLGTSLSLAPASSSGFIANAFAPPAAGGFDSAPIGAAASAPISFGAAPAPIGAAAYAPNSFGPSAPISFAAAPAAPGFGAAPAAPGFGAALRPQARCAEQHAVPSTSSPAALAVPAATRHNYIARSSQGKPMMKQRVGVGLGLALTYLLSEGASPNVCVDDGSTALQACLKYFHSDGCYDILLNSPLLDINMQGINGDTIAHSVLKSHNRAEIFEALMGKDGINFSIANNEGNTSLHDAVTHSTNNTVNTLIEVFAVNVNAANTEGNTALHLAYLRGSMPFVDPQVNEIITTLINKGSDCEHMNNEGKKPEYLQDKSSISSLAGPVVEKQKDANALPFIFGTSALKSDEGGGGDVGLTSGIGFSLGASPSSFPSESEPFTTDLIPFGNMHGNNAGKRKPNPKRPKSGRR